MSCDQEVDDTPYRITQGDTLPSMVIRLTSRDVDTGVEGPIDLTNITSITVKGFDRKTKTHWSFAAAVLAGSDPKQGFVSKLWTVGDTNSLRAGINVVKATVVFTSGDVQTFPLDTDPKTGRAVDGVEFEVVEAL